MASSHAEELETLLRSPKAKNHLSEIKLALTRLSSELRARVERGSATSYEFFVSTVHAVSKIGGTSHAELRVDCLFNSGIYFYRTGRAQAAFETARLLVNFAERTGNKYWVRKAHTLAGMVNAEAGNVAQAVVHFATALQIAQKLEHAEGKISVLINLGSTLNYGTLYREAAACLLEARKTASEDSDLARSHLPPIYCNLAQCYLNSDQVGDAFDAIQLSLRLSQEPKDAPAAFSRTIREFTYVQIALELGKLAAARDHAALCRKYSQWGENPRCRVMADLTSGLCEVYGGSVDKGMSFLQSALLHSGDFYVTRIDALLSLIKANDDLGRPEEALAHMNELLSFVRIARQNGIEALLTAPSADLFQLHLQDFRDLRNLESREARLRAKVAEREVGFARIEMLERLAVTADLKEEASGEHGYRVGRLAGLLAEDISWANEDCKAIDLVARLHDIGKIAMPDRILLSSQELRDAERHFMSSHTIIGAELLGRSNLPQLQLAELVARHHHECWDGTGYPSKLAGKRIPIHARIVALADVFDALTHGRPFAHPWSVDRALEEIRKRRGTQFDPELTDRFVALIERLRAEHEDLDAYLGKAGRNSPFLQARNKIRLMLEEERENERKATVAGNETRH